MKIWTAEEEAENLKDRFSKKNRAEFARESGIKGGPAMIYQHISGRRPISLDAALVYAKGFNVPLSEISPRLAMEAANAVALDQELTKSEITQTKPIAYQKDIEDVIRLMLGADEIGKGMVVIAVKTALEARKAAILALPKPPQPIVSAEAQRRINEILDNGDWGSSNAAPPDVGNYHPGKQDKHR